MNIRSFVCVSFHTNNIHIMVMDSDVFFLSLVLSLKSIVLLQNNIKQKPNQKYNSTNNHFRADNEKSKFMPFILHGWSAFKWEHCERMWESVSHPSSGLDSNVRLIRYKWFINGPKFDLRDKSWWYFAPS